MTFITTNIHDSLINSNQSLGLTRLVRGSLGSLTSSTGMNAELGDILKKESPMSPSQFVSYTLWTAILLIIFGLLTGYFKNNFTSWFLFAFLVLTGILKIAMEWKK